MAAFYHGGVGSDGGGDATDATLLSAAAPSTAPHVDDSWASFGARGNSGAAALPRAAVPAPAPDAPPAAASRPVRARASSDSSDSSSGGCRGGGGSAPPAAGAPASASAPSAPSASSGGAGACLLINPDKPFRILWESLGVLVIIWVTLSLPFKIAFLSEQLNDADPLFVFQIFVNIFFIADCALNFYTAYYDENDVLVVDGARIKRNYLRSWFVVDFLGAVPFDYIVLALEGHYYTALEATKLIRILKLMRLFRLLNLHNLFRFFGRFEERLSNTFVKVFKLVIVLILWLHLDACFYFFVARWTQIDTGAFAADSWVALNGLTAAPPAKQYLWSVWVVQSQMLSVAYGPVSPVRTDEVCATILSMLFGAVLYAGVIGTTASIIAASDQPGTEWYRQWDEVRACARGGGAAGCAGE
jgi:hypothetical protein